MSKKIWMDCDGTLYDLYSIPNWLDKLRNEEEQVFSTGSFMGNYTEFLKEISRLFAAGYEFGVITWLPMGASPEYEEICRQEKIEWIKQYLPFVHDINITSYGIPKQNTIKKRAKQMILIDDNSEVCKMWETNSMRKAINLTDNFDIVAALQSIEN